MSMKYIVKIREVHISYLEIEAESHEEAISLVADGEGEQLLQEYSHTLDPDEWSVEEKREDSAGLLPIGVYPVAE